MTLQQLFEYLGTHPNYLLYYFLAIPVIILLVNLSVNQPAQGFNLRWFYSVLAFMVIIPGLLVLCLNLYLFLFQRQNIWDLNLFTQVLPMLSMVLTLWLINKKIDFDYLPGFGKLSNVLAIIFGLMCLFWVIDRTHIYTLAYLPARYLFIGFILVLIGIRFFWKRLF